MENINKGDILAKSRYKRTEKLLLKKSLIVINSLKKRDTGNNGYR